MNVTGVTLSATVPTPIQPGSGASAPAVCVRNHGPGMAYLGDSTMVSPATGRGLAVGASLNWPAGSPLFVTTDTTTVIDVYDTVGAEFNPQAIADSLTASGLAGDIANQISIAGTPALRSAVLLQSFAGTVSDYITNGYDTTPYTHLVVIAISSDSGYLGLDMRFPGGSVSSKTTLLQLPKISSFPGLDGEPDYFTVPCLGNFAQISPKLNSTTCYLKLAVFGTNSPPGNAFESSSVANLAPGVVIAGGLRYGVTRLTTPSAVGSWRSYVPHNGKPITVTVTSAGNLVAKYQWFARYYDGSGVGTDFPISNIITVTGGGNFDVAVRIVPPPFGILVLVVTTTSASTTTFDLLYNS